MSNIHPIVFLVVATTFEVSGDALIRKAIYNHSEIARIGLIVLGAIFLLCYGISLNLVPIEFGQVLGLYIATLFVVWQTINFIFFNALPTMPILVGGLLVISGGLIITFWKPK